MKPYFNKYAKPCETCGVMVPVGKGFIIKTDCWRTYCQEHVPVKLEPQSMVRTLSKDGIVTMPYEAGSLDLLRSMPGARWNPDKKHWTVSTAAGDRVRVLEIAKKLALDVAPELAVVEQSQQAEAAHHAGLYGYQVGGVDWLSKRSQALLSDQMGLGKSVETLVALPKDAACLVVCPASVKQSWANETRKWRPDLKPVVLCGKNSFQFPSAGEVLITSYNLLPEWLEPQLKTKESSKWDVEVKLPQKTLDGAKKAIFVCDESARCKNYKTAMSKRVRGLSMICGRVWALTGTPLENRPLDLWGMLSSLGFARLVFGTFPKFIERMNGHKGKYGGYEFGIPQPIVAELMQRVMLRRLRKDVLPDLPEKTFTQVVVNDLPESLRQDLDDAWEQWGEEDEERKELPPFTEFSKVRAKLAAAKIPALTELVEEAEEEKCPLLVFSAHLKPVQVIGSRPGWAIISGETPTAKRQQIVDDFQNGKLDGVALTIKAGGLGLTLTRAWKIIMVDKEWQPGLNEQAYHRVIRIGQKSNKIEIVELITDHPMDRHVAELLAWKDAVIDKAIEGMVKVDLPAAVVALAAEAEAASVTMSAAYQAKVAASVRAVTGETEAEFQSRMAKAREDVKRLTEAAKQSRVDKDGWPEIKRDVDIPF